MKTSDIIAQVKLFLRGGTSIPAWSSGVPLSVIGSCGNLILEDLAEALLLTNPLPGWLVSAVGETQIEILSDTLIQLYRTRKGNESSELLSLVLRSVGKTGGSGATDLVLDSSSELISNEYNLRSRAIMFNALVESAFRLRIGTSTGIFKIPDTLKGDWPHSSEVMDSIRVITAIAEARDNEVPTAALLTEFHRTPQSANYVVRNIALDCTWLAPMVTEMNIVGEGYDFGSAATVYDLLFLTPPWAPLKVLPSTAGLLNDTRRVKAICTQALSSPDATVRLRATIMLARSGDQRAVSSLVEMVKGNKPGAAEAWYTISELTWVQNDSMTVQAAEFLASASLPSGMNEPSGLQISAVRACSGSEKDRELCAQFLMNVLNVRTKIMENLGRLEPEESLLDKKLQIYVDSASQLRALGSLGQSTALKYKDMMIALLPMLGRNVRQFCAGILAGLNDPDVDDKLAEYLDGETSPLVHLAVERRNTLIKFYDS